jgi:putative transposase|tara:strand:+ start:955 stop:1230 length:276 start_codon:yes stop_codon:yes gene_type:complete
VGDYNRGVLAIEIDLSLPSVRVVRALERILAWRGCPVKIRMDNGPEFTSVTLAGWAEKHDIQLEFIKPDKPTQNSYVEGFNKAYRTEVLNM